MKVLPSDDAFFLYSETPDQHQHTLGLLVLDPATAPGKFTVEQLSEKLEQDLHALPEFRQRLVKLPMALSPPVLVDDPYFNYEEHIQFRTLKAPGSLVQLSRLISRFSSEPLDKKKPLWETLFIDGLEDGMVAVCTKSHHLISDGVQGAEFMAEQFDFEPNPSGEKKKGLTKWTPAEVSTFDILGASWSNYRKGQPGFRTMFNKTLKSLGKRRKLLASKKIDADLVTSMVPSGPRLKFNGGISAKRSVALGSLSMASLKAIKNHYGVTLNDVVLAACALSLRDYLIETEDLPDEPVICGVPVSLRMKDLESDADAGNQVGNMFVKLPVQIADPAECLMAVHAHTVQTKSLFDESFENLMLGYIGVLPPALANSAMKALFNRRVMEKLPAMCNLLVSNFPGPPIPLFMQGAKLQATYPIGPVMSGQGLNMTFMSMMGDLNFSVHTCSESLPDAWDLAEGVSHWVEKLNALSEAPKPSRKAVAKKKSTKGKTSKASKPSRRSQAVSGSVKMS